MKYRKATIAALLISLGLFGAAIGLSRQDPGQPGPPPFPHRGPGMDGGMLLSVLDLTEAQKSKVRAINEADRTSMESIVAQLHEASKAIEDATANGQFDEQQIRTLAATEAQLQIEMRVAAARRQAAIYQVLTTDQQTQFNKIRTAQRSSQNFMRRPQAQ